MDILQIVNEKDMERAIEILKENNIEVCKDSALRLTCFEEAQSVIDYRYSNLDSEKKDELLDCLTEELYKNSHNIFDGEYIDYLASLVFVENLSDDELKNI